MTGPDLKVSHAMNTKQDMWYMYHTKLCKESHQLHSKIQYEAYSLRTSREYVRISEISISIGTGPVGLGHFVSTLDELVEGCAAICC